MADKSNPTSWIHADKVDKHVIPDELQKLSDELDNFPDVKEFEEASKPTQIQTLLEIYRFARHNLIDYDTDEQYFEEFEMDVNTKILLFILNVVPIEMFKTYDFKGMYVDIYEPCHNLVYGMIYHSDEE